ncbi:MAG TPA: penicillin-binding transpeptidase domain-containing protein [Candidatus Angelobacter sp.]|nr:penicillin-binding transpeptidase domain-containing protein [Candidatus Angelobacter sp.]
MNLLSRSLVLVCVLSWTAHSAGQSSIASRLQKQMADTMGTKPGAVVVLDVATGKLLAERNIAIAAQRLEAPGSTVKPFILLELLRLNKVEPAQRLACHRPLYIGGHRMDCTHSPAVASLDATDAIAYSCNTYFSSMALRMTPSELAETFRRAGFTSPTGLASGESIGRITAAQSQSSLQLQALGDWGIEVTPLELLAAYRRLALQKQAPNNSSEFAKPVFLGLERSVLYGAAHAAQPLGTSAAGKTGTASGVNQPGSHGFFVGYAPADKPEIVLLVYLEHGRGTDAAAVAAPLITSYWKLRHGDAK